MPTLDALVKSYQNAVQHVRDKQIKENQKPYQALKRNLNNGIMKKTKQNNTWHEENLHHAKTSRVFLVTPSKCWR